jgi:hypothetical protein
MVIGLSRLLNRPIAPVQSELEVAAQLVQRGDPHRHQLTTGPAQRPQCLRVATVLTQPSPALPVGAQRVGQHVGVEAVILVAR